MQYHSLQHWTLLLLTDTSTTECHFHFGPAASFLLELLAVALRSSPVAYWIPSNSEGSTASVIYFSLFILFTGLSQQEYWRGLSFSPPVDLVLSELSTMTCPSWVALHGMAHSFIELHKPLHQDKAVIQEGGKDMRIQSFKLSQADDCCCFLFLNKVCVRKKGFAI